MLFPWPLHQGMIIDYVHALVEGGRVEEHSLRLRGRAYLPREGMTHGPGQGLAPRSGRAHRDRGGQGQGAGGRAKDKKVALPYFAAMVAALENLVADPEEARYQHVYTWWKLIKIHGCLSSTTTVGSNRQAFSSPARR
jgi:hypothetical protein